MLQYTPVLFTLSMEAIKALSSVNTLLSYPRPTVPALEAIKHAPYTMLPLRGR